LDWDGVGTFAMFLASGAVGVGVILLRAYKARLAATVERARIESSGDAPSLDEERIAALEGQLARLTERLDFNEQLLTGGSQDARTGIPAPDAER